MRQPATVAFPAPGGPTKVSDTGPFLQYVQGYRQLLASVEVLTYLAILKLRDCRC